MEKHTEENNVTLEELVNLLSRFNGVDANGESKAVIAYQTFAVEEPEDSVNKKTIYNLSKVKCEISMSKMNPGFISIDLIFNSWDDAELRLLWGRLQRMKKYEMERPDQTHVFYFNLVERDSISSRTDINDMVYVCHIVNPLMSCLTRNMPADMARNNPMMDELTGGNILRMVIPSYNLNLTASNDFETDKLKGEVEREDMAREYVDNYEAFDDGGKLW